MQLAWKRQNRRQKTTLSLESNVVRCVLTELSKSCLNRQIHYKKYIFVCMYRYIYIYSYLLRYTNLYYKEVRNLITNLLFQSTVKKKPAREDFSSIRMLINYTQIYPAKITAFPATYSFLEQMSPILVFADMYCEKRENLKINL